MLDLAARLAGSVALVLIFGASAASKVRSTDSWRDYTTSLRSSRAVPRRFVGLVAPGLVLIEVAVVALQLVPAAQLAGAALATGLTIVLTVGVGVAVTRGATAQCQCFGAGATLSRQHVGRNCILVAIAAMTVLAYVGNDQQSGGHATAMLLGILTGVVLAAVIIRFEDMVWAVSAPAGSDPTDLLTMRGAL